MAVPAAPAPAPAHQAAPVTNAFFEMRQAAEAMRAQKEKDERRARRTRWFVWTPIAIVVFGALGAGGTWMVQHSRQTGEASSATSVAIETDHIRFVLPMQPTSNFKEGTPGSGSLTSRHWEVQDGPLFLSVEEYDFDAPLSGRGQAFVDGIVQQAADSGGQLAWMDHSGLAGQPEIWRVSILYDTGMMFGEVRVLDGVVVTVSGALRRSSEPPEEYQQLLDSLEFI